MKNKWSWFSIVSCCIAFNLYAGDESANGGDAYASEFIATAKILFENFRKMSVEELKPLKVEVFEKAISVTEVHSESALFLSGNEVDAINYPEKRQIQINRGRWENLRKDSQNLARANLVLHEYLGIMGIDDSQYQYSQKLIEVGHCSSSITSLTLPGPDHPMGHKAPHVIGVAADFGLGLFPGGFQHENIATFTKGGTLSYYLPPSFAIELSVENGIYNYTIPDWATFSNSITMALLGGRYHFIPESMALIRYLHPYLSAGGGIFYRKSAITAAYSATVPYTTTQSLVPGFYLGAGTKLYFYQKQLSLGVGIRYQRVFWNDSNRPPFEQVSEGNKADGYFSGLVGLEYLL